MKTTEPKPLIEIIRPMSDYYKKDGKAKFKGKLLSGKILNLCDDEYLEVDMPAEILFDFNAGELPDEMSLGKLMTGGECMGLLQEVNISKRTKHAELRFGFQFDAEEPPESDLNPFVTLPPLIESIKKKKYKIFIPRAPWGICVLFKVPLGDNVYSHYKKHFADLEKIWIPIESEIIKRLNKKLKTKK